MYWLWLHIRLSLYFGWTDMWKFRDHLVIGVVVALVAVVLSYIATGAAGALYVLLAWPSALAAIYLFLAVRRLTGWDGRWEHGWRIDSLPNGRRQVTAYLTPRQGPLQAFDPPERSCMLRLLAGQQTGPVITPFPGKPSVSFEDGAGLAPGAYAVIWRERKLPGMGRLHNIAYYRRTVPPATPERPGAFPRATPGAADTNLGQ